VPYILFRAITRNNRINNSRIFFFCFLFMNEPGNFEWLRYSRHQTVVAVYEKGKIQYSFRIRHQLIKTHIVVRIIGEHACYGFYRGILTFDLV